VVLSIVIFIGVIRGAVEEFVAKSSEYEQHINDIIKKVYTQLGLLAPPPPETAGLLAPGIVPVPVETIAPAQPPTVAQLLSNNATSLAQLAGNVVSSLVGDMVLVFIYVAFLIVTAGTFARKLDRIFVRPSDRHRANLIGAEVRRAMEQYLWGSFARWLFLLHRNRSRCVVAVAK
jgi:predicted PurR-regulated permease PerM